MRDPGRIAAAIEILEAYKARPEPLSVLMTDWGRRARYAGSKDRAFVRGLCLDILRHWKSHQAEESLRVAAFLTLKYRWAWPPDRLEEAFSGEHGPGALNETERESAVIDAIELPTFVHGDVENLEGATAALKERAPVDLRVNTLKSRTEKAQRALQSLNAERAPLSALGFRVPAEDPTSKGPGVTVIPAFGKGWVEVQDEGSQLTVEAVGVKPGQQVLDFCAGAGGKSLALAAAMENKGQVFAYDIDTKRLAPIHERIRRAGARNIQVIPPSENSRLDDLRSQMDIVFVDAPCSGAGTWRRHPDAKWRLTEKQVLARQSEQDAVLEEASLFVKPGGTLFYVTCSFLTSENDDRVALFLDGNPGFSWVDPLSGAAEAVTEKLAPFVTGKALRLTPWTSGTDGFTAIRLERKRD